MRQQKLKQMQERKQQLEQQKNQKEPPVPLPPPPGAAAAAAAVATKQEKTGPVTKFIGKNLALNADHPSGRPHNPQMIRKTVPPPRALHGRDKEVLCKKGGQRGLGDGDYRMLSKIKVADEALIPNKPRLFCGIYTHEKAHTRQVKAVRDTWANKCDGFAFFSTGTANRDIGTVEILHEGEEGYNNMWQKVREIWAFVAAVYAEDYDYFWLGGDDVFMIPENMKAYLGSDRIHQMNEDPNNPGLFIGARKKEGGDMDKLFNSGGAGYVLSRKTLRALERQLSTCRPNQHGFWEDVNVALCLKNEGILPIDTRDDAGSERFHLFNPGHILSWRPPKPDPTKDWFYVYSMGNKVGMDCCSDESIVFHYVKEDLMRRSFALVYQCGPLDTPSPLPPG